MIKEDLSAELKIVLGYLTLKEPYDNAFNTPEDAIKKCNIFARGSQRKYRML